MADFQTGYLPAEDKPGANVQRFDVKMNGGAPFDLVTLHGDKVFLAFADGMIDLDRVDVVYWDNKDGTIFVRAKRDLEHVTPREYYFRPIPGRGLPADIESRR